MGLKKGKYAYVELEPGRYVKVRVVKSRADDSPSKYLVVSPETARVPERARVVRLDSLPEPARRSIAEQLA